MVTSGTGFYGSNDLTNSVRALKDVLHANHYTTILAVMWHFTSA